MRKHHHIAQRKNRHDYACVGTMVTFITANLNQRLPAAVQAVRRYRLAVARRGLAGRSRTNKGRWSKYVLQYPYRPQARRSGIPVTCGRELLVAFMISTAGAATNHSLVHDHLDDVIHRRHVVHGLQQLVLNDRPEPACASPALHAFLAIAIKASSRNSSSQLSISNRRRHC